MIRHTGCNTALEISPSKATAFLDDYAFPISGLLDLYECGGEIFWLAWAIEQQDIQARTYLPIRFLLNRRLFHNHDGSEPSGNSVLAIDHDRSEPLGSCNRSEEANCVDWYKPSEELEEMVAAVHASYETNKTVDPSDEEEMEFWE
ncbi:hypothetical protein LguiB_001063 [Lonicera macranthoides]